MLSISSRSRIFVATAFSFGLLLGSPNNVRALQSETAPEPISTSSNWWWNDCCATMLVVILAILIGVPRLNLRCLRSSELHL